MSATGNAPAGRASADGGPHFVTTAALSSLFCGPDRSATSPLQQRIRHTRLFPPLLPPMTAQGPAAGSLNFAAGLTATPAAATTASSPRVGTSVEAIAPRTVLRASTTPSTVSWQPTRLTSSYCVLSAAGAQEDFYTSALSWGTHQMALALEQSLVVFHPSRPRQSSSIAIAQTPSTGSDVYASRAFDTPRRATAVSMLHCRETACFLGTSNGAVELYEGRGDGRLHCTVAFAMPEPPTDYLSSLLCGGGISSNTTSSRAARALSLLSSSVSSVCCIGTSDRHPWLGAAATAARGLVALDTRQSQPVLRFGSVGERNVEEQSASSAATIAGSRGEDISASTFSLSKSSAASSNVGSGLSCLQSASAFLRQHDRLCSVSWNATGSLVATGSSGGIVKVWSLSAPHRPLHNFLVDHECTVKALAFHPERPYELLVGGSAGPAGLRTYDLAGTVPILTCCGATAAPVMQAVYDPAGNYAVTCAGTPTNRAAAYSPSSRSPLQRSSQGSAAVRGDMNSSSAGSVLDGSPRWRLSSPSRSGSGVSFGLSASVPLLQDSQDDMDVAAEDASTFFTGIDGLRDGVGVGLSSTTPAHSTPSNAVVLWRCASRCRDNYLREALLREHEKGREVDGDDLHADTTHMLYKDDENENEHMERSLHPSSVGERRARRGSSGNEDDDLPSGEDGWPRSVWLPMTSLPGHRARPLLICAPFPQSPFSGCYASLAAGEDCTIRFWRLFEIASDATHWQHRRHAQQRSATTQDMDLFTTPVLR